MTPSGPRWTGETRLWEPELTAPLKLKKPARIFVADMGDLFYEGVSDEDIDRVLAVMALAPQHTFLVLTKRAERMWKYVGELYAGRMYEIAESYMMENNTCLDAGRMILESFANGLPNCHLGISVEDQKTADERIPFLLRTLAAVRWISYEPALGSVDFHKPTGWYLHNDSIPLRAEIPEMLIDGINWIVVGGESGPGARPCDLQWIRSAVEQCQSAGEGVCEAAW